MHGRDAGTAPAAKLDATRSYGARAILERSTLTVIARAQELAAEHGYTFVHPFDDAAGIAGQGTVGLEILASPRRSPATSRFRSSSSRSTTWAG